jgi:hypothetical protein
MKQNYLEAIERVSQSLTGAFIEDREGVAEAEPLLDSEAPRGGRRVLEQVWECPLCHGGRSLPCLSLDSQVFSA